MSRAIEVIARGVWIAGGRVLLCRNVAANFYYLPGGHVEPGESSSEALARELFEETGECPVVGRGIAVLESRFVQNGVRRHEINLVFHVEQSAPVAPIASREPEIEFAWFDVPELLAADLRPIPLRMWLLNALVKGPPSGGVAWLQDS